MAALFADFGADIPYPQLPNNILQILYWNGDIRALNELFRRHEDFFHKKAEKVCRKYWYWDPDDAFQDLYIRLTAEGAYRSYNPGASFGRWAGRILVNLILERSRRQPCRYWVLTGKWRREFTEKWGIPASVCDMLKPLSGKRYYSEPEFRAAVEALLSAPEFAHWWAYIVERARHGRTTKQLAAQVVAKLTDTGRFHDLEIAEYCELMQKLVECFHRLSREEQLLLQARYAGGGETLETIAKRLGVCITTARTKINKARAHLEQLLSE